MTGADGAEGAPGGGKLDAAHVRRRLCWVLLGIGVVLLAGVMADRAKWTNLEAEEGCDAAGGTHLAGRGPVAVWHDEANETTYAVFAFGHGSCDVAVRVDGRLDADPSGERGVWLAAIRHEEAGQVPPGAAFEGSLDGPAPTAVLPGTFVETSFTVRALGTTAGLALTIGGAMWAAPRVRPASAGAAAAGLALGCLLSWRMLPTGMMAFIVTAALGVSAPLFAMGASVLRQPRWAGLRMALLLAAFFAAGAVAFMVLWVAAFPFPLDA